MVGAEAAVKVCTIPHKCRVYTNRHAGEGMVLGLRHLESSLLSALAHFFETGKPSNILLLLPKLLARLASSSDPPQNLEQLAARDKNTLDKRARIAF